ncbi:helix-turn-helix transcriptional regulator [Microbulbifer sp. TRSA001]|uniref:helix-turn-helix transcriptional regulator n=1 Tax=unclassified Microbulbifer TaxID=2619833 RepID=UPI0024ACBD82|nr:helix-turn-helix domain-containing protein [Microbulbifer sp. VAAF005]WHI44642.1 helix-turn-helix domain-containing protein [Microbulbifer sp. VAAF005]
MSKFLTIDEAAEKLGISRKTLLNRNADGSGPPYYRPGKQPLYKESEVNEWIEMHRVDTSGGRYGN